MYHPSVPVASLPNELLAQIHEAAIITYSKTSPLLPTIDLTSLSYISCVCKRWRENILDNGPLWAVAIDVDRYPLAWVQELLRRSKASPLTITSANPSFVCNECALSQDIMSEPWRCIFDCSSRWGIFKLESHIHRDRMDPLTKALKRPSSNLTWFMLSNTHDFYNVDYIGNDGPWQEEQFILPHDLFGGYAPHLKIFHVINVYIPTTFDFSVWQNLTTLKINQMDEFHDDLKKRPMHNWLDILRPMVLLEELSLEGVFSYRYDVETSLAQIPDVCLNRLARLTLASCQERQIMFDFFAKLIVPSTCIIFLRVLGQEDDNVYPPSSFAKLKIGLDRHVEGLLAAQGDSSLAVELQNNLDGISFSFALKIRSENTVDENGDEDVEEKPLAFQFAQVSMEDMGLPRDMIPLPTPQNSSAIPHAGADYPFSQLLAALEDVPASTLLICSWPTIVAEDIDPLCRFLSRCKHADRADFYDTNPVMLEILQGKIKKHPVLLPNLKVFSFVPDFDSSEGDPRLKEFLDWRESIGMLPERLEGCL